MKWYIATIIGMGIGLVLTFFLILIIGFFKKHKERKEVKKMIQNKEFIVPLDKRDYVSQRWKDVIDLDKQEKDLQTLNEKIYGKPIENEQ